jgi:membrane fusion protein (multidrug efflux system)
MNDAAPAPAGKRRRILTTLALIFAVLGGAWWLMSHYVWGLREHTDDAYVAGHQISVSSQVPGTVVEVAVDNTALVEAGQVLVRLDPIDAATALARAEAQLAQAVRQVRQQRAVAQQQDAQIGQRKLELARAEIDLQHRTPLAAEQAIAAEDIRHAQDAVKLARVALQQAQQQAAAAHVLVDGGAVRDNPWVADAVARYRDAFVMSHRNAIIAPVRGYVAQRNVQLGQRITPGQPLMSVIALDDLWIDANFKENQLRNLRLGQAVEIESDLYGSSAKFHGRVVGLAAGTGGAFSLLPPQNATGNWIKVVQRVPVKVSLDAQELAQRPLRIGLSTTVYVDTHDRDGQVLAQTSVPASKPATDVYANDMQQAQAAADAIIARHGGGAAH